jgi:mRNA interferase MazF
VSFEPLDVVVVPFPFSDRQVVKRRPALVVSSSDFNAAHTQSIRAMITSSAGRDWPSDVVIADWRNAGLAVPCRVRLKLFTLDNDLVLRRLGRLSARDAEAVRAALDRFLR